MILRTLDRYVLRVFLAYCLVLAFGFLGLITVLDLIGHGDELGESSQLYGAVGGQVLRFYLLNLPFLLVQFAPYILLLAGMATVMHLARAREWTPMLTAGRPTLRAFVPIYVAAFTLALGVMEIREAILPRWAAPREALMRRLFHQRSWTLVDLWARGEGDVRLLAGRFDPGTELGLQFGEEADRLPKIEGLEVYSRGPAGEPRLMLAETATWLGASWSLQGGRLVTGGLGEEPVHTWYHPGLRPADLVLAYFGQVSPLDLSLGQLRILRLRDPDHRLAATLSYAWWTAPLVPLVLLLLGLPFVLRFEKGSALEGVGTGLLLCAFYFVADFLLRDLGGRGVLSPFFGGAGALMLCLALGIRVQDRLAT